MPKKGSLIPGVTISDLVPGGDARGYAEENGQRFALHFNPRTVAPGDVVSAQFLGAARGVSQARVESREFSSPVRRAPLCQHFGICGGCSLQHLPYAEQLRLKEAIVTQCLGSRLYGVAILPTLGCESEFRFRNKMEYTASARAYRDLPPEDGVHLDSKALGLFVPFSGNKVLDLHTCLLQHGIGDRIRAWTASYAETNELPYYHSGSHQGYLRTVLIRTNRQGQALVMFIVAEDRPETIAALCAACAAAFPDVRSVWYLVNTKMNDSYVDQVSIHATGEEFIVEKIGSLAFRVGPQTFLQVNTRQSEVLYEAIMQQAELQGTETVYDLYCGVGTISAWAALRAAKVVGIEYVESAVHAARAACTENNIHNADFFAGNMKDLLVSDFFATHGHPDLIITDPPRAGMHPKASAVLAQSGTPRIIYVSCNPTSLARDLDILSETYTLKSVQAIDLMPQSHHIETLAVLELK